MSDATIRCPKCQTDIPLTEAMAGPLLKAERERHAAELRRSLDDIAIREQRLELTIDSRAKQLSKDEVERQRKEIKGAYDAKYEQLLSQTGELQSQLSDSERKLYEAQMAQAEAIRKSRELDDAKRELELTISKRVAAETSEARTKIAAAVSEEHHLKLAEKEHTIEAMNKQIDDLKRRAEQGSQQLQGEVQELELERQLTSAFPVDTVEPVGKGIYGADCCQSVTAANGTVAGSILWESKRTKNWGGDWLSKLRDDQRAAKADVAVIVSRALPEEIKTFGLVEGVWVTAPAFAIPLAIALRGTLTGVAAARAANAGQETKAALAYRYLTGPGFRQRVEAVVERFAELREDLDRERKFMTKQFAKREEGLTQIVSSMSGLYGDLQGIAGKAIAELPALTEGE